MRLAVQSYTYIKFIITLLIVILGWIIFSNHVEHASPVSPRVYDMGLIYWPQMGHETSDEMIKAGVKLLLDNSEHILVQVPWSPGLPKASETAKWMSNLARDHDRRLTIALDWMSADRKDLLLLNNKDWSFSDLEIRKRFVSDVVKIAAMYEPDYIILGVEVDFLARNQPAEYRNFVSLYQHSYETIKEKSPDTKITVTFQFESTKDMLGTNESILSASHIRAFGPLLDLLGLSVYPCQNIKRPDDLKIDYFSSVIPEKTAVGIFETGWPAGTKHSEIAQADYLGWLLAVASTVDTDPLIWVSVVDRKDIKEKESLDTKNLCSAAVSRWNKSLGLWSGGGEAKDAVRVWQFWLEHSKRIRVSHKAATMDQIDHLTMPHY